MVSVLVLPGKGRVRGFSQDSEASDRTLRAPVSASLRGIAAFSETDHLAAFGALRRLVGGWAFELGEVVFVGSVVDVDFSFKLTTALRAGLPGAGMAFGMMRAAERESVMVPGATLAGVGEQDVLPFVIANPLAAALGQDEVAGFSAQPAAARGGTSR